MFEMIEKVLQDNPLVTAFALVGLVSWISVQISRHLTGGRVHGSAIAIVIGLAVTAVLLAYAIRLYDAKKTLSIDAFTESKW